MRSCFWSSIKQSSLGHLKCNQEVDLTWSDPVLDSHRCPVLLLTGRREGRESLMYNCHHFQLVIDHVLFFAIVTGEGLLPPSENMSRSLTAGVIVFFFLWFSTCCQKFCPTLPHLIPMLGQKIWFWQINDHRFKRVKHILHSRLNASDLKCWICWRWEGTFPAI